MWEEREKISFFLSPPHHFLVVKSSIKNRSETGGWIFCLSFFQKKLNKQQKSRGFSTSLFSPMAKNRNANA
jgi:hypothetical protein